MRKLDPADVRVDFNVSSDEIINYFDRVDAAISAHTTREGDLSQLATQSFLALFVAFERFCSDLLLAYLNRDFSQYQSDVAHRLALSVNEKFGAELASRISYQPKKHVSVAELEEIVDPTGWNLTFSKFSKIREYSVRVLAAGHAARIQTVSASEARLVDTARSIRDFIAHQSPGSKERMNEALATVEQGGHNRYLGRVDNDVHNVGAYLKASGAGVRRLHRYAQALRSIAAKM